nr:ATP synthase F0 subunit 8 [Ips shangrila]
MPQMAPMNWLSLFIFFSFLFFSSIMINFYFNLFFYSNNATLNKIHKTNFKKNWKW